MKLRLLLQASGRFLGRSWVWCALYIGALLPLTLASRAGRPIEVPPLGDVAPADITAPVVLERVDEEATLALRQAARDAVPPVYDLDVQAAAPAVAYLTELFEAGRRGEIDASLPEATRGYLEREHFAPAIEARFTAAIEESFRRPIAGGRSLLPQGGPVILRLVPGGRESRRQAPFDAASVADARRAATDELQRLGAPPREFAAIEPLLAELVVPSLTLNASLTEGRRRSASSRIEPLLLRVPAGKTVVEKGEIITEDVERTLFALNRARAERLAPRAILGHLLLLGLLLFFIHRYVYHYQKTFRRVHDLFSLMVAVMVVGLALDCGFLWVFERIASSLQTAPYADPALYRFMVPVATGTMLITLLVNPRAAMAFSLFYVPLLGLLMEWDLRSLLFGLLSCLAGIYGITTYRRRAALIRAGLLLGVMNAVCVLALGAVGADPSPALHLWFQMCGGLAGGILVSVLVSFLLPLLESLFNILTDVRLLELSNLDNPLLRRLAVESPGTYHHSIIVGTLAEAAAESIGGNSLFCRVAAYYHDVGKMVKASYFVENQKEGENRHDRLTPHLSARVIASHVREGMELARTHGVPQEILDIIPQHHGTRRINYFYQKARRAVGPRDEVRESDFRYPGPRPQTRAAALIMLADSIEAAARSLDDSQPARLKGVVNTIVSDVVLDDQFSECDLSFSDLERVRAAFFKTLCSIHHHRIDYPGFEFDAVEERPFRASPTHDDSPADAETRGR